jgi:hypothetical protein
MLKVVSLAMLLILTAVLSTGCASIMCGQTQELSLDSVPQGASVNVPTVGTVVTPAKVELRRGTRYDLTLTMDGFPERKVKIDRGFNPAMFGNILFGGIPGIIIDMATGAAHNISPHTIVMDMATGELVKPESKSPPATTSDGW